jgi:hypothetical protein
VAKPTRKPSPRPWRWEGRQIDSYQLGRFVDANGLTVMDFGEAQSADGWGSPPGDEDRWLILQAVNAYGRRSRKRRGSQ